MALSPLFPKQTEPAQVAPVHPAPSPLWVSTSGPHAELHRSREDVHAFGIARSLLDGVFPHRRASDWKRVADDLGLELAFEEFHGATPARRRICLRGQLKHHNVTVIVCHTAAADGPGLSTSIVLDGVGGGYHPIEIVARSGAAFADPGITTGDQAFDGKLHLRGEERPTLARMTGSTRGALLEVLEGAQQFSIERGTLSFEEARNQGPRAVQQRLSALLELASALVINPDAVWDRVRLNAETDPLEAVRARNADALREWEDSYYLDDLWFFIDLGPYESIMTADRAARWINWQYRALVECGPALSLYPAVQFDELGFWYSTLRGLGALDVRSLRGMLTEFGWRGVVWGGWLALMSPQPEFKEVLLRVQPNQYRNDWAVRCALAHITQTEPEAEFREIAEIAGLCRERLRSVEIVRMPLRVHGSMPTEAMRLAASEQRKQKVERVRQAYQSSGTDAALALIGELQLGRHPETAYPDWYRKTQHLPPRSGLVARYLRAVTSG
jgi:hypothetical protein